MNGDAGQSARRRLEELGIAYTEEAFLRYVALGDGPIVDLFLESGIRASAKNAEGKSALLIASAEGHTEIARKLIAGGADASELVDAVHKELARKKDVWDKLSALSAVATILVAGIGGWFTYTYNSHQLASDTNLKAQQNRISEMDIVSKMMPYLTKDEQSKCGALLVITTLANPELAVRMARFYQGSGSVCALEKIAVTGDQKAWQPAVAALSTIASSNRGEDHQTGQQAVSALSMIASSSSGEDRKTALGALSSVLEKNAEVAICTDVTNFHDCHEKYPTGCSLSGSYDAYLNLLKNQLLPPNSKPAGYLGVAEFSDLEKRTPQSIGRQNHATVADGLSQLGEGRVFGVIGFLYEIKAGGRESANCQLFGDENLSYHFKIGFSSEIASKLGENQSVDRKVLEQTSIVAQITPRSRSAYHPEWTLEALRKLVGRQVKITGQLLFNNTHGTPRDDCGLSNADLRTCWRASAWELTPVTQVLQCQSGLNCSANSDAWVELPKAVP